MVTKVYKGFIKQGEYCHDFDALFIGDDTDPIALLFEEDFSGKNVSVRYWTSDVEKTKEELQENVLRNLFGDVDATYEDVRNDITGYLWTDQELNIGGHNLLDELRSLIGKFVYLEVDIHET